MDWRLVVGTKVLLLVLLLAAAKSDNGEKRVVCYYTNWSVYRPGTAKYSPQNINPYLCTHLIYAFGGFTKDNTLKPFDKYQDVDKGGYAKFTGLKTYNKELKVLMAIGGWNEGSSRFSPMVADPQRRRKFVKSAVKFLRQNHFDGLDLDWEYPAFRDGGKSGDRDNYASFVQELAEEFDKESSKTGKPRLLLTMAVPAGIEYIDKGYDIPKLNEHLDFINLLSYDYHSAYEPAVNHHAPLYPLEEDNEYNYDNELTIDYTVKHLLKNGATREKIVIGIPTYGRSYTLFNEDATALGSPADGPGEEGDATREKGYLAYYEICEGVEKGDWTVKKPNAKAMGPFAYKGNQWVGYDDEDIVRAKARYVSKNKLGGVMFWSIDNDDFRGKCHGRPYPLIEAAKEALFEENGKEKEDERPNAINTRKRSRVADSLRSSTQRNAQKSTSNSSRKNAATRQSSDKRSSSNNRTNSRSRNEYKLDDESNDENNEPVEATKISNKSSRSQLVTNNNRFKARTQANDRDSRRRQITTSTTTRKPQKNRLSTPEPPTTPDPGSDFKCEDEGFFPHPRDCKKYFWCLNSGPSNLGIVANKFTCPSGLVFNKLADSCDYPRNVVCPKVKPNTAADSATKQTTTTTTTTEKEKIDVEEEDEEEEEEEEENGEEYEEHDDVKEDAKIEEENKRKVITTTARSLLYKTINRSRPTITTTTTSSPKVGSARFSDDITDEEQDPKVIKDLIELIKKAGGIEQLERQLALQEKSVNSGINQENGQATPATISKSLYERVLSQQSGKSNFFKIPTSRLASNRKTDEFEDTKEENLETKKKSRVEFANGPGRSQFEGLDEVPEVKSLRRHNSPKYVTIERHGSSTLSTKIEDDIEDEDEDDVDGMEEPDNEDEASSEEKLISNLPEQKISTRPTPGYINIRRTRPVTTTELSRIDSNFKESVFEEEQPQKQYVHGTSFRHTDQTQKEITEDVTTPKTRYVSANRFRSTTIAPIEESEQNIKQDMLSETTPDENLLTTKITTTISPFVKEQTIFKTETTKLFNDENQEPTKYITTQLNDEGHVTTKYSTEQNLYSKDPVYAKSTATPQYHNELYVTGESTTPKSFSQDHGDHVTEGKTITVAGESGRISISSFSAETPSTARIFTDDLSSTLKSSIPYTEEKFISTYYTTKQMPQSTVPLNPNTVDDSVTESAIRVTTPTEATSRVTLAAVSQPRPFGFPRRSRPTTASTASISETTLGSVTAFESTPKSKVKPSRNPGFNSYRRPGTPSLPRGTFSAIPSAKLPPTTKIYPVQFDIENSRVLGLVADQNGNPQNLELILADPPALISSTTDSGKQAFTRTSFKRKTSAIPIQTTTEISVSSSPSRIISSDKRRQGQKYNTNRVASYNSYQVHSRPYKPAVTDYDYYDDEEERFVGKPNDKIYITSRGFIKCMDQGNFAHPDSCKKFISCAKIVDGKVVGTEYTCPPKLSFDPIGGMCNWSAGLGCNE